MLKCRWLVVRVYPVVRSFVAFGDYGSAVTVEQLCGHSLDNPPLRASDHASCIMHHVTLCCSLKLKLGPNVSTVRSTLSHIAIFHTDSSSLCCRVLRHPRICRLTACLKKRRYSERRNKRCTFSAGAPVPYFFHYVSSLLRTTKGSHILIIS